MNDTDLAQSQDRLGAALDRARMGEDRDLASQVRDAGERFVRQLFGALRLTRIHDLENAVFEKPVHELSTSLQELNTLLGAVSLVTVEGQVYINDVRVRLDERLDTAAQLGRELGRHDIGGLTIHEPLGVRPLKAIIDAFGQDPDTDHPRAKLRQRLVDAGLNTVDLVGSYRFRVGGDDTTLSEVDVDKVRDRASSLVDATIDSIGASRMPNPLPIRRTITEMLNAGTDAAALWEAPANSTPFSRHTLRVSMLAMVIGRQLDLPQEILQDLGVTAMLHDVGYAAREGAIAATATTPAVEGYAPPMSRHGSAGARMLLRQRGFHESKILRALGALHHTWDFNDPRGCPTLFGRILHVCESYDAITVLGPKRRAGYAALAALQEAAGTRYDPVIVQALVNGLGRYPPGTQLELEDNRRVRVTALPTGAEDWDRPKCVVVRNTDGTAPRTPQQLVLSRVSVAIKRELGGH